MALWVKVLASKPDYLFGPQDPRSGRREPTDSSKFSSVMHPMLWHTQACTHIPNTHKIQNKNCDQSKKSSNRSTDLGQQEITTLLLFKIHFQIMLERIVRVCVCMSLCNNKQLKK